MEAKTYRSKRRRRVIRAVKTATAAQAIGTLQPGCEIFTLTYGQFSLIDALCAILQQTGPANVTLCTWTAADVDLRRAARLLQSAEILSMRFVVDRSFLTRQPKYCQTMRDLFGDDCIRTARSHAKWMIISNDKWKLAIRTSMNMNSNPRLETIEISDDPGLCKFFLAVADDLFSEQQAGIFNGELPELKSVLDHKITPSDMDGPDLARTIDEMKQADADALSKLKF